MLQYVMSLGMLVFAAIHVVCAAYRSFTGDNAKSMQHEVSACLHLLVYMVVLQW